MAHVAIAPLVIARDESGHDIYIYGGQPVPDNVTKDEIARLEDGGFIASEKQAAAFPDGDPAGSWTIAQLKAYADAHSIDLGGAKKQAEILAVLAK